MNQPVSNRVILSSNPDDPIMKQVLATHLPDGIDVDVKPLLHIVQDILRHSTINLDSTTSSAAHTDSGELESNAHQTNALLNSLSHIMDKLHCELSSKYLSVADAHTTVIALFKTVGNFHWDAKLILTLAAFALTYGEFWLLAQIYSSNQLARSLAVLRQVPTVMDQWAQLKPRFDLLSKLIETMLALTQCIVHFKELPPVYITSDAPAMATALNTIPTAVYWTFRGIIACASQIASLTSIEFEYGISSSALESWELSTLNYKINKLLDFLKNQLEDCHRVVGMRCIDTIKTRVIYQVNSISRKSLPIVFGGSDFGPTDPTGQGQSGP